MVDGGTAPPLAAVEDVHERLAAGPLGDLRLAVLHGRMPADDKDRDDARLRRAARSTCSSRPR